MMRAVFLAILSLVLLAQTISADDAGKVNPYGKFLSDSRGLVEIEMATIETKNSHDLHDVLLKVTGLPAFQHGIDGKVLKYAAVPAGTGFNLQYKKGDDNRNLVTSRQLWGSWKTVQIHLDGQSYDVSVDGLRSKGVRPEHLASAYKQPQETGAWKHAVNPYGLSFSSIPDGLGVEIAYYKEKNKHGFYDALVKITGEAAYNAGIDGKVIRYKVKPSGRGVDYTYEKDGAERNRISVRGNHWLFHDSYELYFGSQTFKLYPGNHTGVRPLHLQAAFEGNQ